MGEFKTGRIRTIQIILNTTLSRRIQDRAKVFASEQKRNSNLVYMYITRIMANIESLDFKRFLFSLQIVTWESNYKVYKNFGALYIVHPVSEHFRVKNYLILMFTTNLSPNHLL